MPRNLIVSETPPEVSEEEIRCRQKFHFCRRAEYEPATELLADVLLICRCDGVKYEIRFSGDPPEGSRMIFSFFCPSDPSVVEEIAFDVPDVKWSFSAGGASVYGPVAWRNAASVNHCSFISYWVRWSHV